MYGICPIAKYTMNELFMAGCMTHARNGYISTSVFLAPDFLNDMKILAIRVHLRQI